MQSMIVQAVNSTIRFGQSFEFRLTERSLVNLILSLCSLVRKQLTLQQTVGTFAKCKKNAIHANGTVFHFAYPF